MLKNNGKKAVISAASSACFCLLLLLLLAVQHHRAQLGGRAGAGSPSPLRDAAPDEEAQRAPGRRGISAYLSKLSRGRREADKPGRLSAAPADEPPPAEDLGADDIFIAVKTTKKFHQSRLHLLMDTWISRNMQQVSRLQKNQVLT